MAAMDMCIFAVVIVCPVGNNPFPCGNAAPERVSGLDGAPFAGRFSEEALLPSHRTQEGR